MTGNANEGQNPSGTRCAGVRSKSKSLEDDRAGSGVRPSSAVRLDKVALIVCAAAIVLLWLAQVTPYLNVADDSGRYMVLGEAIARTGDLRLINQASRPLDTLYPPGFPAIIAFWLIVTGRSAGGVVLLVKATQLVLLLATLPLLLRLLLLARISPTGRAAALAAYALSPAVVAYANEVMAEMPLLFLTLAAMALVEQPITPTNRLAAAPPPPSAHPALQQEPAATLPAASRSIPAWRPLLALACSAAAFLVRTSGIALLLTLPFWAWRRLGRGWGAAALAVLVLCVGGWLGRNRHVERTHPQLHYQSYLDQFALRDPSRLNAGRIALSPRGLLSRMHSGFPTYVGMISRAVLYVMGPSPSGWLALFYVVAVPLTLLVIGGWWLLLRGGMTLTGCFSLLFWLVAALWPWKNARFLVPLIPFFVLFAASAAEWIYLRSQQRAGIEDQGSEQRGARRQPPIVRRGSERRHVEPRHGAAAAVAVALGICLLAYYGYADSRAIREEREHTGPRYALGRYPAEGGFYSACAWLRQHGTPGAVVMAKPPYLAHLYSAHPTTQIDPITNPRAFEKAAVQAHHVQYLIQDAWSFGFSSRRLLAPYFNAYGDRWTRAWTDPQGSGVTVWQRRSPDRQVQ